MYEAHELSDKQLTEVEQKYHAYLQTRIELSREKVCASMGRMKVISPKHVFLLSYPEIIREVGLPCTYDTMACESKNGDLKRKLKAANNSINSLTTIMRVDGDKQASLCHSGWYSKQTISITATSNDQENLEFQQLAKTGLIASNEGYIFADTAEVCHVTLRGGSNQAILVHKSDCTDFEIGLVKQIVVPRSSLDHKEVGILYESTKKTFLPNYGVYSVKKTGVRDIVRWKHLADFKTLYVYSLPEFENQLFCSLPNIPVLF